MVRATPYTLLWRSLSKWASFFKLKSTKAELWREYKRHTEEMFGAGKKQGIDNEATMKTANDFIWNAGMSFQSAERFS